MSKGNRIICVRFGEAELAEMGEVLAGRNERSNGPLWCMSDFVRAAVVEKLAKMRRSRTRSRSAAKKGA